MKKMWQWFHNYDIIIPVSLKNCITDYFFADTINDNDFKFETLLKLIQEISTWNILLVMFMNSFMYVLTEKIAAFLFVYI